MIAQISLLTALMFSIIYPLCFWINFKDPLKNDFHKFHVGLPNVIGGITLVFILLMNVPWPVKIAAICWKAALISISCYYWKKPSPSPIVMTVPSVIGLYAFYRLQSYLLNGSPEFLLVAVLGGAIFCSCLYAMNLGHWYLNVHGLPLKHLVNACQVFWVLLGLRGIWDIYFLFTETVMYRGNNISLFMFLSKFDGFLIWVAVFFGLIFPFVTMFFVRGTLAVKNTQSTTGILYVILGSVLIGDMTYKYYLIKYGIAL